MGLAGDSSEFSSMISSPIAGVVKMGGNYGFPSVGSIYDIKSCVPEYRILISEYLLW